MLYTIMHLFYIGNMQGNEYIILQGDSVSRLSKELTCNDCTINLTGTSNPQPLEKRDINRTSNAQDTVPRMVFQSLETLCLLDCQAKTIWLLEHLCA